MKRTLFFGQLGLLLVSVFAMGCRADEPRNNTVGDSRETVLGVLGSSTLPRGMLVYQRPDGIYLKNLADEKATRLVEGGTYPRFSPDGKFVAFMRGNDVMRISVTGGSPTKLATAARGRATAYHSDGKEILFTDGERIRAVRTDGTQVRTLVTGHNFRELDISPDGMRLATTVRGMGVHIRVFDLASGEDRKLARGCSVSVSPDGRLVTNNRGDHTVLALIDWATGNVVGQVDAPAGRTFDNQFWSNHKDWLVSVTEGDSQDILIHRISQNQYRQITSEGDCDRPDLYVRSEVSRGGKTRTKPLRQEENNDTG